MYFFSTDHLNPHRKKRHFYELPYSTVRCGAFFVIIIILPCGAVRCLFYGAVRCGLFFSGITQCGPVRFLLEATPYGAVRLR